MKKVIYFLFALLVSIVMISCSDMTVSSGYRYTYDPYPYSSYYYYYRPYYPYYRISYKPVYRERIIVVPQHRNNFRPRNNNIRFGNGQRFGNDNFQFWQRQRNNSGTTGHFGNGRR